MRYVTLCVCVHVGCVWRAPPPPPQPHYLSVPSLRNNHVRGKDCANLKFLIKTICLAISHKHSYCLISSAVARNDPSFCQPLPPPPIKCTAAPSPPSNLVSFPSLKQNKKKKKTIKKTMEAPLLVGVSLAGFLFFLFFLSSTEGETERWWRRRRGAYV